MGVTPGVDERPDLISVDDHIVEPRELWQDELPSSEGVYDKKARLADMDTDHVEAALCYPNIFPRFAGQGFAERADKDLALTCLRIYNDWMIDGWCGGDARGRLIPLTLVPRVVCSNAITCDGLERFGIAE